MFANCLITEFFMNLWPFFPKIGKTNPVVLSIDEVVENENYALIISTNGGYGVILIGDTVLVTSNIRSGLKSRAAPNIL